LDQLLSKWDQTAQMSPYLAVEVDSQFDALMKEGLSTIESLMVDQPELALGRLILLTSILNSAAQQRPAILKRLEKWIQKLRAVTNALGKKLGANGFSIAAGLPVGISVGLSFPVQ
ncbi:hypothetical protein MYX78_08585, partial [Acidobacteria bacterium AH-259-G07]|nr:hypothetical protein [Acidobacteria bacterium AH-259-G07]